MKDYWFISYYATGCNIYANTAINIAPSEWIKYTYEDDLVADGPYVILYAERITKDIFDWFKDNV